MDGTGWWQVVVRFKAVHQLPGQHLAEQLFDGCQQGELVRAHQRNGLAALAGAPGAADAVDVILRHLGQVEVHHLG